MAVSALIGMNSAVAATRASYRWKLRQWLLNGSQSALARCRPGSNRGARLCRPLPSLSVTAPGRCLTLPLAVASRGLDDAHRSVSLPRGTVPPVRVIEPVCDDSGQLVLGGAA